MTQNFFIFGNHPRLSAAELKAVLEDAHSESCGGFAIDDGDKASEETFARLGGAVKCGVVVGEAHLDTVPHLLCDYIVRARKTDQKIYFGLSSYGARLNTRRIGLAVKKMLAAQGVSSRFVVSRGSALSSVVVQTNKLLSNRGIELVLFFCNKNWYFGETRRVQAFAEFSARDYGRPMRDARSGMLPPKLARIMLNLARAPKNERVLDPFCGSGTILQEAALLGYHRIIGADISTTAIASAQENLNWLGLQTASFKPRYELFHYDARHISKKIPLHSLGAIITEPYLGPPLKGNEQGSALDRNMSDLEQLYRESIAEFAKILKPGGALVIIFPIIQNKRISLKSFMKSGFTQDKFFVKLYDDQNRASFNYRRPRQRVAREIFVLRSKLNS